MLKNWQKTYIPLFLHVFHQFIGLHDVRCFPYFPMRSGQLFFFWTLPNIVPNTPSPHPPPLQNSYTHHLICYRDKKTDTYYEEDVFRVKYALGFVMFYYGCFWKFSVGFWSCYEGPGRFQVEFPQPFIEIRPQEAPQIAKQVISVDMC